MEYNCKVCDARCLSYGKCSNGVREITLKDGETVKIYPQENINGFNASLQKDGTRYNILVIPFKGELGCGYIDIRNGYLVINGIEKTAYAFGCGYLSADYIHEKLIRDADKGWGKKDAENTKILLDITINHILSLRSI